MFFFTCLNDSETEKKEEDFLSRQDVLFQHEKSQSVEMFIMTLNNASFNPFMVLVHSTTNSWRLMTSQKKGFLKIFGPDQNYNHHTKIIMNT